MVELISKKHHVIKQSLTEILNIDSSVAETDACAIEHVISNKSISDIREFMRAYKK
ncbi:iron dependent repressor, metal binding and dimerization domain protein [Gottschalkia purinilytica]|uniref:iron dependent repressor, metal binding and dimerization domain protein n=1 Tax=Gottschalkia purinilytica TaxID=1503 RepID=UPI0009E44CD8